MAAVAAPLQVRECPAVLWIKQNNFGGRLVRVILPRLSCCGLFVSLSQAGGRGEQTGSGGYKGCLRRLPLQTPDSLASVS